MPSSLQDGKRKSIPRIQSLLQFIKPQDRKMQPSCKHWHPDGCGIAVLPAD
jgi:hypothetical protein